jgi:hypothetical protein
MDGANRYAIDEDQASAAEKLPICPQSNELTMYSNRQEFDSIYEERLTCIKIFP